MNFYEILGVDVRWNRK